MGGGEQMNLCACSCGQVVKEGNRFIHGHHRRNVKVSEATRTRMSVVCKMGINKGAFKKGQRPSNRDLVITKEMRKPRLLCQREGAGR